MSYKQFSATQDAIANKAVAKPQALPAADRPAVPPVKVPAEVTPASKA